MIIDNLIKECSCGETTNFKHEVINAIPLLTCNSCGTPHQYLPGWDSKMVVEMYALKYHTDEQEKLGRQAYKERYDHDKQVAILRLNEYNPYLHKGMKGLDIGSSNSAFVHAARAKQFDFMGIDPGHDIGDSSVTVRSTIQEYDFSSLKFDIITMHDSLEHMVEVRKIMQKVVGLMNDKAYLIIDIPDYYVPEGLHHWRPVQHLWYWNRDQMIAFLQEFGLSIVKIANPIPGKLVFYAQK